MERYLGRCEAVLVTLTGLVPAEGLIEAQHLIDCRPRRARRGFVLPCVVVFDEDMPPNLDDLAIST